ncbi:uncharacterized protein [Henckelia pumila]|uniref:uncharacterized protein n=1 Tax=Henckelia pumila TaxID=405737 RepID=UPI003C6E0D38
MPEICNQWLDQRLDIIILHFYITEFLFLIITTLKSHAHGVLRHTQVPSTSANINDGLQRRGFKETNLLNEGDALRRPMSVKTASSWYLDVLQNVENRSRGPTFISYYRSKQQKSMLL